LRVVVIAIGRLKQGFERELAARYLDRAAKAGRALGMRAIEIIELDESRAGDVTARRKDEADRMLARVPSGAIRVALDETGDGLTSAAVAQRMRTWLDASRGDVAFLIGGPDGLDGRLKAQADLVLALGQLTWPHQLVRIMILEQIYRVTAILSGHPYHRA
jgi:23S rRNA (pseudouridine1915-N3)-methyltransferase